MAIDTQEPFWLLLSSLFEDFPYQISSGTTYAGGVIVGWNPLLVQSKFYNSIPECLSLTTPLSGVGALQVGGLRAIPYP
jgi:hypothetical protein